MFLPEDLRPWKGLTCIHLNKGNLHLSLLTFPWISASVKTLPFHRRSQILEQAMQNVCLHSIFHSKAQA